MAFSFTRIGWLTSLRGPMFTYSSQEGDAMTEFAGKVAVVTGGGSGIGRGQVMALANEGASVVVADIIKENADRVAAEVQQAGGTAVAVACDVSDRDSVKKMKAEANDALGPVSLLFATAGVTWFDRLTDMSEKNVDWVIQVNLMGTMYCMQAFLPDMIEAREGHVVATASNAGLKFRLGSISRAVFVGQGWNNWHDAESTHRAGRVRSRLYRVLPWRRAGARRRRVSPEQPALSAGEVRRTERGSPQSGP